MNYSCLTILEYKDIKIPFKTKVWKAVPEERYLNIDNKAYHEMVFWVRPGNQLNIFVLEFSDFNYKNKFSSWIYHGKQLLSWHAITLTVFQLKIV